MEQPKTAIEPRRSRAFLFAAILCALLAFLPGELLLGDHPHLTPENGLVDEAAHDRDLAEAREQGAWPWRLAFLALSAFLVATARGSRAELADEGQPISREARHGLLLCVVVAALVRIPGLNLGLWFDELWMLVEFVRADFAKAPREFPADNHHPLYTMLAWVSVRAFGEEPWALRLPAWLFGVASIPALFALGRGLIGERRTLVACGLLALSYHHVSFSQSARGYAALLFFTLLSTHGFLEALRTGKRSAWVLQGVALALATFAHTTAIFLALAQGIVWLFHRKPAPLLGLVLGGLVSLVLHALMLPQMIWFFVLREGTAAVDAEWKSPLWTIVATAQSLGLATPLGYAALAAALAVGLLGLVRLAGANRSAAAVFVLTPAIGGIAMLALGRNLWPRFFFFCAGFFVLLGAVGLDASLRIALADKRKRTVLLVGMVLPTALFLPKAWFVPKQDYASARDWVLTRLEPGDVGATVGLASFPYEDYYGGGFTSIGDRAHLESVVAEHDDIYVLSTFGVYLQTRDPDLYAWLKAYSEEVARFPGSIGDGDLVVVRVSGNGQ